MRISIDDFGNGYTSLGAIRKLPTHEIKIDKSFVFGMTKDKSVRRAVYGLTSE